jgi:hypothetical protein
VTEHNRTEAAKRLLARIELWCDRTGTPESTIGHALFGAPGFVGLMRKRLTVSGDKEQSVRDFFEEYPDGFHGELPALFPNGMKPRRAAVEQMRCKLTDEEIAARRLDRDACPRCGVRADIGCKHQRAFA